MPKIPKIATSKLLSHPATNKLVGNLAARHGPGLIDDALARLFPRGDAGKFPRDPDAPKPKPTMAHRLARFALLRVATKSVPGALLVGGGLIAKTLYDKHQDREARLEAKARGFVGKLSGSKATRGE